MTLVSILKKHLCPNWSKLKASLLRREGADTTVSSDEEDTDQRYDEVSQMPVPVMECSAGSLTGDEYKQSVQEVIMSVKKSARVRGNRMIGFPMNLMDDFGALDFVGSIKLNNLGDPYVPQDKWGNTLDFEVGVLDWFASLWEIESPHYWGYMTTGGTESTMYSLYSAREEHPDGLVYASEDTHYSVQKLTHMLKIPLSTVQSLENGEIDYAQLKNRLIRNLGRSAIIVANIGTTMKGAIDNIGKIAEALRSAGYSREKFYIHCDAALFGVMLPFTQIPCKLSFKQPIDSISVSGHKFLGCPHPCGILISRRSHRKVIGNPEIVVSPDATITGSRSGHAPLYLWYVLSMKGKAGIEQDVRSCLENAELLKELLIEYGVSADRNSYSNIVVFKKPTNLRLIDRWHLACVGSAAHVVVMPHMKKPSVEKFASEMGRSWKLQV